MQSWDNWTKWNRSDEVPKISLPNGQVTSRAVVSSKPLPCPFLQSLYTACHQPVNNASTPSRHPTMSFVAARILVRSATRTLTPVVRSAVRPAIPVMALRGFSAPSAPLKKDVLTDLIIKELKAYKPVEEKGVEAGQVKELHIPSPPKLPNLNEDLTAELAAYDAEEPEEPTTDNLLLEEEEEEEEEAAHGHGH
ncbi:hypothetical protein BC937DRAFT_89836 [Endogone sp. FLAS-F59071]|nr:hypothetical protein BC937DRAFT_89836 [Endogone sp. FLAS-F59071]|eukprot:RUS17535.1 hypothetical protein BC937DRAFT_89836 [Endogone sp. FLAS-F59071]